MSYQGLKAQTDVIGKQAAIFANIQGLTPEEMIAPLGDLLDELSPTDSILHAAKAHLAGFVHNYTRYLIANGK